MIELIGKKVLVAGMARSGLAATRLLNTGRRLPFDRKETAELEAEIKSLPPDVGTVLGSNGKVDPGVFDLVVTSPGIPLDSPLLAESIQAGVPVISEIELAYRLKPPGVDFLAVTGTNGKTTTTALIADILRTSGIPSAAAGNIGIPLTQAIEELAAGMIAVECSSFQLETIESFHPRCSGVINITPDHLDRHRTMENYAEIKSRIFMNQDPDEYTVLNHMDP